MTGYGYSKVDLPEGGIIAVEISSLNHKYKDYSLRLPKELYPLEMSIRRWCEANLTRGKYIIKFEAQLPATYSVAKIREDVLTSYFENLDKIKGDLKLLQEIRLDTLLFLPGVLENTGIGLSEKKQELFDYCEKALKQAYENLIEMRKKEGKNLYQSILNLLDDLKNYVSNIEKEWENKKESLYNKLKDKLLELVKDLSLDETRLHTEVAILVDKWDITEEIERLKSHLLQFRTYLDSDPPNGKRLDFLSQEINREISTISSKVPDANIRQLSVDARVVIDSIREQLQNVE